MTAAECRRWRPAGRRVLTWLLAVPTVVVGVLNGYLAVLTVAAASARHSTRRVASAHPAGRMPRHRFAVLIPAHDEAAMIASTLESVARQDYPPELVTVHVVADNCTDETAVIAARHDADVHERFDLDVPGKGPALGWLVERLDERNATYDAAVILDADTSMAPRFMREMDVALDADRSAWQAHYAVSDPTSSSSIALRAAALALRHYVRPLGRTALGGSCGLFGNGMVLRSQLVRQRRFSSHLTEDVEFQLELLLDGELVAFVPEAVVEAEMPSTFDAARAQNERWELGRLQLARTYVPRLLRQAARRRAQHRAACIDAALDQLVPPLSVLAAATSALFGAAIAARDRRAGPAGRATSAVAAASLAGLAAHVIGGLRVAGVPRSVYVSLAHAPRLVGWKIALWLRVLRRPGDVGWTRTARNQPVGHGAALR